MNNTHDEKYCIQILTALDSFKGSLTSIQAGNAIKEAAQRIKLNAAVQVCALADGGEGTVDALSSVPGFRKVTVSVTGLLGTPVSACYCMRGDTAVLEMAQAAGLPLVPVHSRNPMDTITYGVGEMILHAIKNGCQRFEVGIGGSTTNDGGAGMLQALGYRFLDDRGEQIPFGCKGLAKLCTTDGSQVIPELKQCSFRIACDVTNPLCGENGCSAVYSPQKGATAEMISKMDSWLSHFASITNSCGFTADEDYPGAGAAGGLGFAFLAFTKAVLESGIKIILEETGLEEHIKKSDLVITGEGRLDGQSIMGKAPVGVAMHAKHYGKPVIAFCGCTGQGVEECLNHGIDAYYAITPEDMDRDTAMKPEVAYENLVNAAAKALSEYFQL